MLINNFWTGEEKSEITPGIPDVPTPADLSKYLERIILLDVFVDYQKKFFGDLLTKAFALEFQDQFLFDAVEVSYSKHQIRMTLYQNDQDFDAETYNRRVVVYQQSFNMHEMAEVLKKYSIVYGLEKGGSYDNTAEELYKFSYSERKA